MNIFTLNKAFIISFLFVVSSVAMEKDLDDISWLELARLERDASSSKKQNNHSKRDNDFIESRKGEESSLADIFKQIPRMTFERIVGEIPEEIIRIVHRIKHSEYYEKCHLSDFAHEVLLIGPPGTGKSSLAEAIATETGSVFYKVGSSALINSYQGSGAGTIRTIYEDARKNKKAAVIFIDEIDGISNNEMKSNTGESDRAVKELQIQIDRRDLFIICILATNNFENLSGALKDRFAHKTITIPLPSFGKRLAILRYYAAGKKLNVSKDFLSKLAKQTDQLSCRCLEKLSVEAFNIAFQEQFNSIEKILKPLLEKKNSMEEKGESEKKDNDFEPPYEINDMHYLVAMYTTQNIKLPDLTHRIFLFNYFFKKERLGPYKESVVFLAKKADGFTAKDIKNIVVKVKEIYDEKSKYTDQDMKAAFYHDQTITFADSFMRAELFEYYLEDKNILFKYCNERDLCSVLGYFTEDNFTGKEISDIVDNAHEMAEIENIEITEKHLIVALYKGLMKKARPYVISIALKVDENKLVTSVEASDNIKELITPIDKKIPLDIDFFEIKELQANEKHLENISFRAYQHHYKRAADPGSYRKTRLDYRTKLNPNAIVRFILIQHFFEDIPHELSPNQIHSLAMKTEGLSWYSLAELIKLAKNHAIGSCCRAVQFGHLMSAAYEFEIKLEEVAIPQNIGNASGCVLS